MDIRASIGSDGKYRSGFGDITQSMKIKIYWENIFWNKSTIAPTTILTLSIVKSLLRYPQVAYYLLDRRTMLRLLKRERRLPLYNYRQFHTNLFLRYLMKFGRKTYFIGGPISGE